MMTQNEIKTRIDELMAEQNPIDSDLFALKIKKKEIVLVIVLPGHHDPDTVCLLKGKDLNKGLSYVAWDQISRSTLRVLEQIEKGDKPDGTDTGTDTERDSKSNRLYGDNSLYEDTASKVGAKSDDDPADVEDGS